MPQQDEETATWNSWARRFNAGLAKGFEKTFPDFLEVAVRKMYHDGWKPEEAANAFIWGIRQVEHYRPVDITLTKDPIDGQAR